MNTEQGARAIERGEQTEALAAIHPPSGSDALRVAEAVPTGWWSPDITTRQRVLLTAQPLFRLLRAEQHVTSDEDAHYDHFALAFKAFDLIIENTGLEREIDQEELRLALDPLLGAMDRAEGRPSDPVVHDRVIDRTLSWLMNDTERRDPFSLAYTDVEGGEAVRRTHRVRLVYEHYHPDGRIVLRLSKEAILLYLRALDEDIEDQQAATEAIVQSQIARGRYDEAVHSAENALHLSRAYGEKIADIVRQTRMNVLQVDWAKTVLRMLDEATVHIEQRLATERNIQGTTRERLRDLDVSSPDVPRLERVTELMQRCFDQHMDLHRVVTEAPQAFLAEDAKQGYLPASRRTRPHLLTGVLEPIMTMPHRTAVEMAATAEVALSPPAVPEVFWLPWLIRKLLQPRQARSSGVVVVEDVELSGIAAEPLRYTPETWSTSTAYLIAGERRLSEALSAAEAAGEDRATIDLIALRGLYAFSPDHDERAPVHARVTGTRLSVAGISGDDLLLTPTVIEGSDDR